MTRISRKRKLETIVLSDSEEEPSSHSLSQVAFIVWDTLLESCLLILGSHLTSVAYSQQHIGSHYSCHNQSAKHHNLGSLLLYQLPVNP